MNETARLVGVLILLCGLATVVILGVHYGEPEYSLGVW